MALLVATLDTTLNRHTQRQLLTANVLRYLGAPAQYQAKARMPLGLVVFPFGALLRVGAAWLAPGRIADCLHLVVRPECMREMLSGCVQLYTRKCTSHQQDVVMEACVEVMRRPNAAVHLTEAQGMTYVLLFAVAAHRSRPCLST